MRAQEFAGADVRFGDVQDMESLRTVGFSEPVDVVVSCLASRTGGKVSVRDVRMHAAWCLCKSQGCAGSCKQSRACRGCTGVQGL